MAAPRTPFALAGFVLGLAAVMVLVPLAAASGSGYDQSFTGSPGAATNTDVALTSLSSNDPGGANITISFTVEGTVNLQSDDYGYYVWFGGSATDNSTASVEWDNNTTGFLSVYSGSSSSFGTLNFTSVHGGTATFSIAKAVVGPASSFSVNINAVYTNINTGAYSESWLGSEYSGSAGCSLLGCSSGNGSSGAGTILGLGILLLVGIIVTVVVVIIIIVVVVVVVAGRSSAPPAAPMTPPPPMYGPPPGSAPYAPPPPGPPGYGSPPPPPPPPPPR